MLLSPRRIPKRFNRRVSPQTKALLTKRQGRQRGYMMERWRRAWARWRALLRTATTHPATASVLKRNHWMA